MSELLHCPLLEVGGRVYRVYGAGGSGGASGSQRQQHRAEEAEEVGHDEAHTHTGFWEEDEVAGAEEGEEDPSIVPDGDGRWKSEFSLDSELFGLVIGQKGKTKLRLEQDTGCEIIIPRRDTQQAAAGGSGSSASFITLRGPRGAVARARTQLSLLVSGALQGRQLDYNYFVSLPLAAPSTSAGLVAFQEAVLADPGAAAAGIERSIFMHPQHLHLTLCMLKLYSDEARATAAATLRSLTPAVQALLAEGPLQVQLRGLEYMNDEPGSMHVLYLGVRDGAPGALDRLRRLCTQVVEAFSAAGLLLPQDDRPVKLHATVINTRYRKRGGGSGDGGAGDGSQQQQGSGGGRGGKGGKGGGGGGGGFQRQPFDGRALLAAQGDLDLGQLDLPALHLSQRGRYDSATGFYACAASLPLSV